MLYRPKAYKHPVLAFFSADYLPGPRFDCDFTISDDRTKMHANFTLEDDYLNEIVADGKAFFGVEILCTETISRKFFEFESHEGSVDLQDMDLFGHIECAPLLVARKDLDDFSPGFINPEYTQRSFSVQAGEPLAIGAIYDAEIQRDHHQAETPFEIETKVGKPPYWFSLDTEQNALKLYVSEEIGQAIQIAEKDPVTVPYLYQGIYLSTVALAVERLKAKIEEDDRSQFWVRRLISTLDDHGIDLQDEPQLVAGQLLYNRGWKLILRQQEEQD